MPQPSFSEQENSKSNNSWNTPTHLQYLYASTHSTSAAVDITLPLLSWFKWQMLILPVSLFLEELWNSAKLGMGVTHYLLCLLVKAAKEKNYILSDYCKVCTGTVKLKFWSVSFVGKRKIKLIPCKWNKDDSDWSLKNQEEILPGLRVCHIRFREITGRCFSSYLHIKTSSQAFQIIQNTIAALFNWSLIISAAGAY